MIEIDENELIESLQEGYEQLELAIKNKYNRKEISKLKNWCVSMEMIIFTFAPEYKQIVLNMRNRIIKSKKKNTIDDNLDVPTIFRK
ncbi:hypothetical protein MLC52_06925 [Sulfurimonas sp. NW15]|uniref:hypothetical protein n=1 Tax=Sulfurimonas sp. NW15 TaxID=2922729 RepID=UPI003DA8E434